MYKRPLTREDQKSPTTAAFTNVDPFLMKEVTDRPSYGLRHLGELLPQESTAERVKR